MIAEMRLQIGGATVCDETKARHSCGARVRTPLGVPSARGCGAAGYLARRGVYLRDGLEDYVTFRRLY